MKKLFLMIAAVAALFATSCVTDTASDVQVAGGEVDVTLSVKAPGADSRATIGTGLKATNLTCAVYDHEWKYLTTKTTTFDNGSLSTTIEMRLVKGKEYNFVFWAQSPEAKCYTLNFGTTVGEVVNPNVFVNYNTDVTANDDHRDAFFGNWNCTVQGTINHTVELYRPFAQINFGTSDHFEAEVFGFDVVDNASATTTVTTRAYNTLYLATGEVDVNKEQDVTFAAAALPVDTTLETKNGNYHWLAMNYILVPEEESSLSTCKMTVAASGHSVTVEVPMAPAKRNWRTNLVGKILTEQGNLTIQIDPILEQSDEYLGVVEVGTEEEFNAAFADPAVDFIVLTGDVHLTQTVTRATALFTVSAGKSLTIDLNGHKLTAETPQMFEVLGTLVVKNGTIENPAGDVFAEDATNVTCYETTVKDAEETIYYDEKGDEHSVVSTWAKFTAALAANKAEIMLGADITYEKSYDLKANVAIDLNGHYLEISNPALMLNIHSKATVKNGTIKGKVYARKGANIIFDGVTFGGSINGGGSTEGLLQVQGACDVYAKDCLFDADNSNTTKSRPLSVQSTSSGTLKFENCKFLSNSNQNQVYVNALNGTAVLNFTNCKFKTKSLWGEGNKAANIDTASAYALTNLELSGNEGGFTFTFNRAYTALTEAEVEHLRAVQANNKSGSLRFIFTDGEKRSI